MRMIMLVVAMTVAMTIMVMMVMVRHYCLTRGILLGRSTGDGRLIKGNLDQFFEEHNSLGLADLISKALNLDENNLRV
jgi:hypothetical protein